MIFSLEKARLWLGMCNMFSWNYFATLPLDHATVSEL